MTETPKKKSKGPIRTEAVVPFIIIVVVVALYFKLFFDANLRSAFEFIGYEVVGAQVDIAKVETSFVHGTFEVRGIAVTNPEKPTHNMVEIGDIKFAVLWDGLLRAKVVIEEMAVEQIAVGTQRKSPGKVKPPEPPKPKGDSKAMKEAEKVGKEALEVAAQQNQGNVFGDMGKMLGGGGDSQIKDIDKNLPSKQKLDAFQKELTEKSKTWNAKLASLPQSKDIDALSQKLSQVKTSNFQTPQEAIDSANKIKALIDETNAKYASLGNIGNDLNNDIANTNKEFEEINKQINKDIAGLQDKFHIPKIDAKSMTKAVLGPYMRPYLAMLNHYKAMAEKVLPANVVDSATKSVTDKLEGKGGPSKPTAPDVSMQPRPRGKGVSYEFGRTHSYPAFWIKRILVSSKATGEFGDMKGEILDITSNQLLTEKPTTADFEGSFPSASDVKGKISIDNGGRESVITYNFSIGSYPVEGRDLVNSPDAKIAFKKAQASLKSEGQLKDFSELNFKLDNDLKQVDYDISASNPEVADILKKVFAGIPVVTIEAKGTGELPSPNIDLESNVGTELQKGFDRQISAKVAELNAKLNAAVNAAVGAQKAQVEGQLNQAKGQVNDAIKKVQTALDQQKAKEQNGANSAAKGPQQQLQQQGQKAVDDLKKQFGL